MPLKGLFGHPVGSACESAGGEEHTEPVVVTVAVAAGQASVELDDPVDGLGAAAFRAVRGEVRQERVAPSAEGASQPRDLRDRAVVERVHDLLGDPPSFGEVLRA